VHSTSIPSKNEAASAFLGASPLSKAHTFVKDSLKISLESLFNLLQSSSQLTKFNSFDTNRAKI